MDWTRGRIIGRGTSASVSIATSRSNPHDTFAVKSVELSRSNCLQREQKIHSTLSYPHIIGYRGYNVTIEEGTSMLNLMMDYAPYGTIADEIHRKGGQLNEPMISYLTSQILHGLKYLHSRGIVHCDIKSSNIILTEKGAKIGDFGCAKSADEPIIGVTPIFMAPEVARGEEQGYPADIWALGCTIIEMCTGNPPWSNAPSMLHHIAFSGESPELPVHLPDTAKDFLNKCLRVNPKERWTAAKLLEHPFLEECGVLSVKQYQSLLSVTCHDETDSPTSILDQGIWSTDEEKYAISQVSDVVNSFDSSKQRIQELALDSGRVSWGLSDSWITVRCHKSQFDM